MSDEKKPAADLKYWPWPKCADKCAAIEHLGVSECENVCPHKHREWNLKINTNQAAVLSRALEIYTRLLLGQIDNVLEEHHNLTWDQRREIHELARQYIFPEHGVNGHPGIYGEQTNENAQIAWDIAATVRQALSWDREGKELGKDERDWKTMMGVNFDDPLRCSNEPLPKFTKE